MSSRVPLAPNVARMRPRLSGGHPWDRGVGPWGGGHRGGAGGSAGHGFLRAGVTRETDYESGGHKALDHRNCALLRRRLIQSLSECCMNRRTPARPESRAVSATKKPRAKRNASAGQSSALVRDLARASDRTRPAPDCSDGLGKPSIRASLDRCHFRHQSAPGLQARVGALRS